MILKREYVEDKYGNIIHKDTDLYLEYFTEEKEKPPRRIRVIDSDKMDRLMKMPTEVRNGYYWQWSDVEESFIETPIPGLEYSKQKQESKYRKLFFRD